MGLFSVFMLCTLVVMARAVDQPQKIIYDINKAPEYFAQFVKDYNRTYKDEADKQVHFAAFVKNLKDINKLNAESTTATFGINKFADYTEEETKTMNGFKPPLKN